jgi:hypothetical protein
MCHSPDNVKAEIITIRGGRDVRGVSVEDD